MFLIHVDVRKVNEFYLQKQQEGGFSSVEEESNFLTCCGAGSIPPRRLVETGICPADANYVANYWETGKRPSHWAKNNALCIQKVTGRKKKRKEHRTFLSLGRRSANA